MKITGSSLMIFMALVLVVASIGSAQAQEVQTDNSLLSDQRVNNGAPEDKRSRPGFRTAGGGETSAAAPSSGYDWSGGYIGGHIGYGWGKGDTDFEPLPSAATFINLQPTTLRVRPKGAVGGIQGGYNWQFGHVVVGGEADISWSNMNRTTTVTPIIQNNGTPFPGAGFLSASQKVSYLGTLRPRVGAEFGKVLVYGTAGLAYARVRYSATSDFRPAGTTQYPASFSKTRVGWTAGAGAEIAVHSSWSVKAEYRYHDFGNTSFTASPTPALPPFQIAYTWKTQVNTFTGGVNFHF